MRTCWLVEGESGSVLPRVFVFHPMQLWFVLKLCNERNLLAGCSMRLNNGHGFAGSCYFVFSQFFSNLLKKSKERRTVSK